MTVLVDPSGGSVDLYQLLPPGGSVLSDLILSGSNNRADAAWFGNGPDPARPPFIGVERKRLGDALQCMQDGRLVEQLRGLVSTYNHVWILIEDEIRPNPLTGILEKLLHEKKKTKHGHGSGSGGGSGGGSTHFNCNSKCHWVPALFGSKRKLMWRDFHHWLSSLTYGATEQTGIVVRTWFTRSAKETADWIWSEYNWWQKQWSEHRSLDVFETSHQRPKKGMMLRPPIEARITKEFDGFGWDRSLAAADRFRSPRELANATVDQWLEVEGVGRKLAEQIVGQWSRTRERIVRKR